MSDDISSLLLICWGKTSSTSLGFHPALYHMLDAGQVARVLLTPPASPRWRRSLGTVLATDAESLATWLPYFIALHDIGKLSPDFQSQVPSQSARLTAAGLPLQPVGNLHHPLYTHHFLEQDLQVATGLRVPPLLAQTFTEALGGHHGEFVRPQEARKVHNQVQHYEPPQWRDLRLEAARHLARCLLSASFVCPDPIDLSAAVMLLTGFTVLCDWLGSDSNHFPCDDATSWDLYVAKSHDRAQEAVFSAGFLSPSTSSAPLAFTDLFADKHPPRPLQVAIDGIPDAILAEPCLAIIEAPTGEGKTEAALALAHRIASMRGTDEFYYALPTTATSNQMFLRLQEHITQRLRLASQCKLVHGQAFLIEDDLRLQLSRSDDQARVHEGLEWFAPRKRALLASFGVGTVDQLELAVLNVRHTALRMIGLAQKVVIIDEVHAYDTYMTTIIELLLAWLRSIGTSVILLSATLPLSRRAALAAAFGAHTLTARTATYPALSIDGPAGHYHLAPCACVPDRRIQLGWLGFCQQDAAGKAKWLVSQVADGGCACWMANTVRKAQDIFQALLEMDLTGVELTLLHAQFPLDERQAREEVLRRRYGPQADRPQRGIVIGTQVLEQSLDLDFDVMATDLAPVDLVLQRAGRLHRHSRSRPAAHATPRLWINLVPTPDGPDLGVDVWVYPAFLLLQTWTVLADRAELLLPADYRGLVDAVYDAANDAYAGPFGDEWRKLRDVEAAARHAAESRLLPAPDPEWSIASAAARLMFVESDSSAAYLAARTRLGDDNIAVIPLELQDQGLTARFSVDGPALRLDAAATRPEELALLRRQLRIHDHDVVEYLRGQLASRPPLFANAALLKDYAPLWLEDREAHWSVHGRNITVRLDPRLGLVITKEGGKACQKK